MDKHPIESIMTSTMDSIRDMVDVNTVIGDPVQTDDGSTVIPVSRVSFGFVSGGGEYGIANAKQPAPPEGQLPFAGGASAGVTIQPMGFLVVNEKQVRLLPTQAYAPVDRVIELAPQVLGELKNWLQSHSGGKNRAAAEDGSAETETSSLTE